RLAAADADRRKVLGGDDRVRADVLADAPGEDEIAPGALVRVAARDAHSFAVVDVEVAVLHQQAADHALVVPLGAGETAALAVAQDPRPLLPLQRLERAGLVLRREQDVDEPFGERLSELRRDRTVDRADHAERRDRITGERLHVRLLDRPG